MVYGGPEDIVERNDLAESSVLYRVFIMSRRLTEWGKFLVVEQFCGGPEDIVRAMAFLRGALRKQLEVD